MLQRIVNFVVTVAGVLLALVIGFWTLLSLVVVAAGAAIVFAFRSRGWKRAREKHREGVIEGEFSVVDEAHKDEANKGEKSEHKDTPPHSSRLP